MPEIDQYLSFMIQSGASDFHLRSGVKPMFRVNGRMAAPTGKSATPFTSEMVSDIVGAIMPDRNQKEFKDCRDTDFAYALGDDGRFRVNVFQDREGVGAVFRHIPQKIMTLEELGLPPTIQKLCALGKGIVLVTGPTGSGKTTTLAAMIDYINDQRTDHIVTIEDPIEFVHPNKKCLITQREVHHHTESFKKALRAALRQDPDIVLLGEMRDLETTETAIETAETGHLVLATLHTTTASSTVDRVIDQFPSDRQAQIRTMLSVSLKGVLSQTLCRRKDGKGRVAALEILIGTPAIANNIRDGKTYQIPSSIQTGRKLGMQTLNDSLLDLVKRDIVDPAEAYRQSVDKSDMSSKLKVGGF
ncbi:MAG: type IV pilus twitching motility protein PilT [Planctomycetota bacterium]|jgi:twitching motility protein PilT